ERAKLVDVSGLDELDVERRAREAKPLLLRAPRDGAGSGRAAVETAFDSEDRRAARHLEGELQRVLVRFRARVHEEDRIEAEPAEHRETGRSTTAHVERHCIALETQRARLLRALFDPARMSVAGRGNCMTTVQIEHLAAARRVQVPATRVAH